MRTTIDLPDDLYRALKVRAALTGVTLRQLAGQLLEQGLRQPGSGQEMAPRRREPPPIVLPARGVPIPAQPRAELRRLDEEEDEARHARPARR